MAVKVCSEDDVELGSAVRVVIDDVPIALVRDSAGVVHAIGDTCTHGDISLSEGFVEDDTHRVLGARLEVLPDDRRSAHPSGLRAGPRIHRHHRGRRHLHRPHPDFRLLERNTIMSVLEIKDLHVSVETEQGAKNILKGVDLTMRRGRDPRHHGPERLRQVDARLHDRRSPEVPRRQRLDHARRRRDAAS